MKFKKSLIVCAFLYLLWIPTESISSAALIIQISQPKMTGDKVVVKLELQNTYMQQIKAARSAVFLLDDQRKVVGHSTAWIIGGPKDRPALDAGAKSTYNFVVDTSQPFNKTKLMVEQVILEDGKLANVLKDVQVTNVVQ